MTRLRHVPNTAFILVLLTLLVVPIVLVVTAVGSYVDRGPADRTPPSLTAPSAPLAPGPADNPVTTLVKQLNAALLVKDHDAFFAGVAAEAIAPLQRVWVNFDIIGWQGATLSIEDSAREQVPAAPGTMTYSAVLAVAFDRTATAPRGTGTEDSGKLITQGFDYQITIENSGTSAMLTHWQPIYRTNPWDVDDLYAAKSEHVTLVGSASEQAAIDRALPAAERGGAWILEQNRAGGHAPRIDGFLAFVTRNINTFGVWFQDPATRAFGFDVAGLSILTVRPDPDTPGVGPMVAGGSHTSTSIVSVGPAAFAVSDGADLFAHEFTHVLQEDAVPTDLAATIPDTRATTEGLAELEQLKFFEGTTILPPVGTASGQMIRSAVNRCFTGRVPTEAELTGTNADCTYRVAATMYGYAESVGYNAFELGNTAKAGGTDPISVTSTDNFGLPPLTIQGWSTWVHEHY